MVVVTVAGQGLCYGSSLAGHRVLLPTDLLQVPGMLQAEVPAGPPADPALMDLVTFAEPTRRFLAAELSAGRLPDWNPHMFAGTPFRYLARSPFALLAASSPSPRAIAWTEVALALVAALGMVALLAGTLGISWPIAALAGVAFPLTGYFVIWRGFGPPFAVSLLPWLLAALNWADARRPWHVASLALATALTAISSRADIGAAVLLVSAAWWVAWSRPWLGPDRRRRAAGVLLGWALGLGLAAPDVVPSIDYASSGNRLAHRADRTARPGLGWIAVVEAVAPDAYGSTREGFAVRYEGQQGNDQEGGGTAYGGAWALLLLAPLSLFSTRNRRAAWASVAVTCLGLLAVTGFPGDSLLRFLPSTLDRFSFAACVGTSIAAAVGAQALWDREVRASRWLALPAGLAVLLAGWLGVRAFRVDGDLSGGLTRSMGVGGMAPVPLTGAELELVIASVSSRAWFEFAMVLGAAVAFAALVAWPGRHRRILAAVGTAWVVELVVHAEDRAVQGAPSAAFPPTPLTRYLQQHVQGRVLAHGCLPAGILQSYGLREVRGYDGVDPAEVVALLRPTADGNSTGSTYAALQSYRPRLGVAPDGGPRLPPVLDLLGVEAMVFMGLPPPAVTPAFQSGQLWVWRNPNAMPRAWFPETVEFVPDPEEQLRRVLDPTFKPGQVAFSSSAVGHEPGCARQVRVLSESPGHATLQARLECPGLLLFSERGAGDWVARIPGQGRRTLRVDHLLQGVPLPRGEWTVDLAYEPAGAPGTLALAILSGLAAAAWSAIDGLRARRARAVAPPP